MGSLLANATFWTIVAVAATILAWGVRQWTRRRGPMNGAFDGFGRFGRIIVQIAALLPLIWVVAFALFVIRARLTIGDWPHSRDFDLRPVLTPRPDVDPSSMPVHRALVWLGILVLPYLAVAVLILGVALRAWRPGDERKMCGFYFTGCALMALILFVDPGHYMHWFVD